MAIVKIHRILVDMLLYITPGFYIKCVTTDRKGIKKLINQCMYIIYETMVASIIYYCEFCKNLKSNNFNMNPYDPCVANQMVNGLQQ